MHIHANQPNPNVQLNALYAAEKAEAKRETERTRKKLTEFASVLAGECGEPCVVKLEEHEQPQEQAKQDQRNENRGSRKKQSEAVNPQPGDVSISDWA
jgi:hypothetical protein